MTRKPADIRISIKLRGQPTHRIELIRLPMRKKFLVRRDDRRSQRLSEATATEVAAEIRKWLAKKYWL